MWNFAYPDWASIIDFNVDALPLLCIVKSYLSYYYYISLIILMNITNKKYSFWTSVH
jgi:hypothetical protein